MAESINPVETRTSFFNRRSTKIVGGILALGIAGGWTAGLANEISAHSKQVAEDNMRFQEQVNTAATRDGFLGAVALYANDRKRTTLAITDNCSLGVDIQYTPDTAGNVTDIQNYSFTTTLNGVATSRRNANGNRRTDVQGEQVTFTFDNYQDLTENILGPQPCATLANNVGLVNKYE